VTGVVTIYVRTECVNLNTIHAPNPMREAARLKIETRDSPKDNTLLGNVNEPPNRSAGGTSVKFVL